MDTWFDLVHSREKKPNNTDPVVEAIPTPEVEPEVQPAPKPIINLEPTTVTKKRFKGK